MTAVTDTLADGVYVTPFALTLVAGGRIRTTAVATAFGWHVTLGRTLRGTARGKPRMLRCHWWSVPTRADAVRALRELAAQMGHPLPVGRA